jgi:hypothetical protein
VFATKCAHVLKTSGLVEHQGMALPTNPFQQAAASCMGPPVRSGPPGLHLRAWRNPPFRQRRRASLTCEQSRGSEPDEKPAEARNWSRPIDRHHCAEIGQLCTQPTPGANQLVGQQLDCTEPRGLPALWHCQGAVIAASKCERSNIPVQSFVKIFPSFMKTRRFFTGFSRSLILVTGSKRGRLGARGGTPRIVREAEAVLGRQREGDAPFAGHGTLGTLLFRPLQVREAGSRSAGRRLLFRSDAWQRMEDAPQIERTAKLYLPTFPRTRCRRPPLG